MRDFNVVEHTLTDNSRVYAVQGYDMHGARLIVIDCDSSDTANELANVLSYRCFGVEIRDTLTDASDRLHGTIRRSV